MMLPRPKPPIVLFGMMVLSIRSVAPPAKLIAAPPAVVALVSSSVPSLSVTVSVKGSPPPITSVPHPATTSAPEPARQTPKVSPLVLITKISVPSSSTLPCNVSPSYSVTVP